MPALDTAQLQSLRTALAQRESALLKDLQGAQREQLGAKPLDGSHEVIDPTELAYRVLGGMVERRFGRIVNVASLAGLIPGSPGATLYGAVKSYLVKASQSLHLETLDKGVHVSALCPGFTYSEFHDVNDTREQISRNTPPWMWMGADEVAAAGYEAAEANRPICVPGAPNKAIAATVKMLPDEWALALMASQGPRFRGKV